MKVFQRIVCFIVLLVINNSIMLAQKNWTGASNTNWADASNWNPVGVPTAADDVDILNTANDPILQVGTTASIKSLVVRTGAMLTIQTTAVLNIDGNIGFGIDNLGTISNTGQINIGAVIGTGLNGIGNFGGAVLTNEVGGVIYIDRTDNSGIRNHNATTINKGKIYIGSIALIGQNGIINLNGGSFTNDTGAELHIDRTGYHGINNSATITNKGAIHIGGVASIGNIGILNTSSSGVFTNDTDAVLYIGATAAIGNNGIENITGAMFTNEIGAAIHIDRVTNHGLANNDADFTNKGRIDIGAVAAIGANGLLNLASGIFTNDANAELHIDRTGYRGINNNATINNKGAIHIGGVASIGNIGILNASSSGVFTNDTDAVLYIGATAAIGNNGIENITGAMFTNEIGAAIHIDRATNHGLANNDADFINKGRIDIGAVAAIGTNGLLNLASGIFTNDANAELHIDRTADRGINNNATITNKGAIHIGGVAIIGNIGILNASSSGVFTNDTGAVLHIGATAAIGNNGIENITGAVFTNEIGAAIHIDRVTNHGLANNNADFTNKGRIDIGAVAAIGANGLLNLASGIFTNDANAELHIDQAGLNGIFNINSSSILNKACAKIFVTERINNNEIFTNQGYLFSDFNGNHINTGTFTNQGTIEDLQGSFDGVSLDNQDIIVAPVCGGVLIPNALQIGTNNSFTVSTDWYSDLLLTTDVGDYNQASNTFTSTLPAGNHTFYMQITDNVNVCTETVAIQVKPSSNPTITGNLSYCIGGNTTLDAGNWNTYAWSNNQTSQVITATAGTYTVTVSTSNGCTGTDQVTVTANSNVTPNITGNLSYCIGGNTTLDAGNWNTYAWSNNQNTQTITATAGTYTVTVTNSNGCTGTDQITVIANPNPAPSITGNLTYPSGGNTTLDAGNWTSYLWSNTLTTQSITATAGTYTVTVSNSNGCTGTAIAQVMVANSCSAEAGILSSNAATICSGDAVELQITGEETAGNYLQYFFVYTQDNLGNTTFVSSQAAVNSSANFAGLAAGNYLVCAYNEYQNNVPNPSPITTTPNLDDIYDTGTILTGCFDIECSTITVPEAFAPDLTGTGQANENNNTGNNIYTVEVCGGTAPYDADFTFSGGFASMEEYPSENAGCINYQIVYTDPTDWTLTVTDANNCSNSDVVFTSDGLPSNPLPQITGFTTTQETCVGDEDGSITVAVEGGDDSCDDYTYTWSGPNGFSETTTDIVTGNTLEDLAAGSYNVTVTDCAGTTTVQTGINVTRSNIGGRRGRGSGVCKTTGNESWNENENLNVYPNPFGERTMIEFSVVETSNVWLSVYSMDGRKVASILEGERMEVPAPNTRGEVLQRYDFEAANLESGMYLLELQTESGLRQHQQLVVVK